MGLGAVSLDRDAEAAATATVEAAGLAMGLAAELGGVAKALTAVGPEAMVAAVVTETVEVVAAEELEGQEAAEVVSRAMDLAVAAMVETAAAMVDEVDGRAAALVLRASLLEGTHSIGRWARSLSSGTAHTERSPQQRSRSRDGPIASPSRSSPRKSGRCCLVEPCRGMAPAVHGAMMGVAPRADGTPEVARVQAEVEQAVAVEQMAQETAEPREEAAEDVRGLGESGGRSLRSPRQSRRSACQRPRHHPHMRCCAPSHRCRSRSCEAV